jgi:hypothetical protein
MAKLMENPGCKFKTPQDACTNCRALYKKRRAEHLSVLPYNWRDPLNSKYWWLSPSSENPAFKYGKFSFSPTGDGAMFVGLYVEKGLGEEQWKASGKKPSPTMVVDQSWAWHDFLGAMITGEIETALEAIYSKCRVNPEIHVDGGYESPSMDGQKPNYGFDKFYFKWDSTNKQLVNYKTEPGSGVLASLEGCTTVQTLAAALNTLTADPYLWIDVLVAVPVTLADRGADAWNEEQLVTNILVPLEEWVR